MPRHTFAAAPVLHVPEESAPHERTFMQWPVHRAVYPDPVFRDMLQWSIAEIANTIAEFEPVVMLMDRRFERAARRKLSRDVEIWDIPTDDLWCRDAGPLFAFDEGGALVVSHIRFNGWGGKQVHGNDGLVAERVAELLGLRLIDAGVVGEAGGVETDGEGTLIAHESCWVNPNRNTGSREEIEARLLAAYGAEKMIWAPGVKGGDITDYHIDALARFVAPGHLVIQLPEEAAAGDSWALAAFETHDILAGARDAQGREFEITILPEPLDIRIEADDFLASYVNYYVCNGGVIMAGFGDRAADAEAARIVAGLYPDREVVTLDIDPVGETGGGIHCATQQQPRA